MASKGEATKEKLMDIAERHILLNGFSATSIDVLTKEAGITKGGFFTTSTEKMPWPAP